MRPEKRHVLPALTVTAALLLVSGLIGGSSAPTPSPGVQVAPDAPAQQTIRPPLVLEGDGYRYTGLADFSMTGRVLSRSRYRLDHLARYAPVDLAMGWGPMSDTAVLEHIWITQFGRWYWFWASGSTVLPVVGISLYSANMHMVPASQRVREVLLTARRDDVLRLKGMLVLITDDDGFRARSSLSREDTGDGACEIIYVEEARILSPDEYMAPAQKSVKAD